MLCYSHAGIPKTDVKFMSNQLDVLLRPILRLSTKQAGDSAVVGSVSVYGTGEEQQSSIIASFDSLAKLLHSAVASSSSLPLSITAVHGVSPAFRFSEVTALHFSRE